MIRPHSPSILFVLSCKGNVLKVSALTVGEDLWYILDIEGDLVWTTDMRDKALTVRRGMISISQSTSTHPYHEFKLGDLDVVEMHIDYFI